MEKSVVNLGAAGFDSVLYLQEGGSPLLAETAPGAPASYLEFLPATNDMSLVSPSDIVLEEPSEQGVGSVFWDKIGSRGPRPTDLYETETSPMEAVEATMAGGEAGSFDEFVSKFGASPMPNQNTRGGARGSRSKDGNMETVMAQLNQIMGRGKKIAGEAWDSMNTLQKASVATTPLPIVPDVLGFAGDLQMYAQDPESRTPLNYSLSALGLLPFIGGATVFHGSPYVFDKFSIGEIGSGEGAQAYGHGIYLADKPDVAKMYRDSNRSNRRTLVTKKGLELEVPGWIGRRLESGKSSPSEIIDVLEKSAKQEIDFMEAYPKFKNEAARLERVERLRSLADSIRNVEREGLETVKSPGYLYTVDLPDEFIEKMVDWDVSISEQPEFVREAIMSTRANLTPDDIENLGGIEGVELLYSPENRIADFLGTMQSIRGAPDAGEKMLLEAGLPGIKYFDGFSRKAGKGTRNYVVFDDSIIEILEREE